MYLEIYKGIGSAWSGCVNNGSSRILPFSGAHRDTPCGISCSNPDIPLRREPRWCKGPRRIPHVKKGSNLPQDSISSKNLYIQWECRTVPVINNLAIRNTDVLDPGAFTSQSVTNTVGRLTFSKGPSSLKLVTLE